MKEEDFEDQKIDKAVLDEYARNLPEGWTYREIVAGGGSILKHFISPGVIQKRVYLKPKLSFLWLIIFIFNSLNLIQVVGTIKVELMPLELYKRPNIIR